MTVAELKAVIKTVMDEQSVSKVKNEASSISDWIKKAIGFAGISLSLVGVKNFLSECNSIAAEVKATNTQFAQTFKTLDESGEAIADFSKEAEEALENVSQKTGIMSSRMKASFASLGAFAKTGGMETAQSIDFAARAAEAAADSAAYFDKSIEETMDIMKRLMKGNFTLDDNLGFQSTQVTRDADALALYGKKYQELESYQQQEVILQQIINANMRMGAAGQAAREAGEYTNQIGEMSENLKMLKANIGMIGLPIVLSFTQKITAVTHHLKEYIGDVNDETSRAHRIQERLMHVMDRVESAISWIVDRGRTLVDMVGGADNAVRLLIGTVGVFLGLNALSRIGDGLKMISSLLDPVKLKVIATFGAALLLFLLIEDFIGFMNGKDSLFGDALEAAGYDADEVREKIANFFTEVQEDFQLITDKINEIGEALGNVFSTKDVDIFKDGVERLNGELERTVDFLKAIGEFFWDLARGNILDLKDDFKAIQDTYKDLKDFKEGKTQEEIDTRNTEMEEWSARTGVSTDRLNKTATAAANEAAAPWLGTIPTPKKDNTWNDIRNEKIQSHKQTSNSDTSIADKIVHVVFGSGLAGKIVDNFESKADETGESLDRLGQKADTGNQKTKTLSTNVENAGTAAWQAATEVSKLESALNFLSSGASNLINMIGSGAALSAIGNYSLPGVNRSVIINQNNTNNFTGVPSTTQAVNKLNGAQKDYSRDIANACSAI